ncbi:hypothetical protein RHS02_08956, partial [Rhizoctonia solani]
MYSISSPEEPMDAHSNHDTPQSAPNPTLGSDKSLESMLGELEFGSDSSMEGLSRQELHKLGVNHLQQFLRVGKLDDIEKAIEYNHAALELTPDRDEDIPVLLDTLTACYGVRFQRLGGLVDIEKMLEYGVRTLALTPKNHPDLPGRHTNVGGSYMYRHQHLGKPADLEKAIENF